MKFLVYLIYQFIILILMPFFFIRLWVKGKKLASYRKRWPERFGFISSKLKSKLKSKTKNQNIIWFHAVSVGESVAASILVKGLLEKDKSEDLFIIITTMTPTGADQVERLFKDNKKVAHHYLPYDFKFCLANFINKIKPKACVIMETELWPMLLAECYKKKVKVIMANARLSEKSFRNYRRFGKLTLWMLQDINMIFARSKKDEAFFRSLGVIQKNIKVAGNLKYEINLSDDLDNKKKAFVKLLGLDKTKRKIWIAASTHDGEEKKILDSHKLICDKASDCLLILVPRHPNRFNEVYDLVKSEGFSCERRSSFKYQKDNKNLNLSSKQVLLGDSMGELLLYYCLADCAFVGGSLVPVGGHNILEAFAVGCPTIIGPYQDNFIEVSQAAISHGATKTASESRGLAKMVLELLNMKDLKDKQVKCAYSFLEDRKGASAQILGYLAGLIL